MASTVVSAKRYLQTYVALLILTAGTTFAAFLDSGWTATLVALLFALAKAAVIASVFMHVLYEGRLVQLALAGAVIWFAILVTLTANDYVTRGWLGYGGK